MSEDDVPSLGDHRKHKAAERLGARLQPVFGLLNQLARAQAEENIQVAALLDLPDRYNAAALRHIIWASNEMDEPPFKVIADIGWIYRAWMLAEEQKYQFQRKHVDWIKQASSVVCQADAEMDDLAAHEYAAMQSLFNVPDAVDAELDEIVQGLSMFSVQGNKSSRYLCLITAIVLACGLPIKAES